MKDHFAPTLGFLTVALAIASASTLIASKARAETPTIDTTPFVSTRTRAEVRDEVMAARPMLTQSEWDLQGNGAHQVASGYTRAEAVAAYMSSRRETSALMSEDSGSSYLAQRAFSERRDSMIARAPQ